MAFAMGALLCVKRDEGEKGAGGRAWWLRVGLLILLAIGLL